MKICQLRTFATIVLGCTVFANLAVADKVSDEVSRGAVLEEITVTAQKRAQSLQDVPISMTVLGGERLAATAPNGLLDITGSVPNLVYAGGAYKARPEITMRGIFSQVRNIGFDASVGVYVDGVFIGRPIAFNPGVLDVERIEVLRGPQGSLFGKNTISGAMNVVLRRPQEDTEILAEAGYGNYDTARTRLSVNVPLVDGRLYGRFSAFGIDSDGYIKNVFTGSTTGSEETFGGRAQFRFFATDSLEFNLSIDGTSSDYGIGHTEGVTGLQESSAPGPYTIAHNVESAEELKVGGIGLTTEYSFDSEFELTSVTAWRKAEDTLLYDNDNTPLDINFTTFADEQRQFSQEVRIASPQYNSSDYVVGVYYFNQTIDTSRPVFWGADFVLPDEFMGNFGTVDTSSYAAFGQFNYRMNDRLTAFTGLRYTHETKDLHFRQDGLPPIGLPDIAPFVRDYSDSDISPTAGLSYDVSDGLTVYGKFSRGFKSGGFNADFISSTNGLQFESEQVSNYEVGAKALAWERKLRLALAIFRMDYEEMQVSQFNVATGGFTIRNAGEATSTGAELDMTLVPVQDLEFTVGIGYVDATFDSFKDGGGPGVDFDGNRLPRAPEYTANVSVAYHREIGNVLLSVFGDYNYRSSQFTTVKNIETDRVDGYGLANARIALSSNDRKWEVSAWSRNLLDSDALSSSSFDGINGYVSVRYVTPRTFGLNVTYRN